MHAPHTPAGSLGQAYPNRRTLIARALGLIRAGASTRAAIRNVGLRKTDERAVKRLCDARGIARRRNPQPVKFETDTPWPVRIAPR